MFFRFFNIALLAVYFFSGYTQLVCTGIASGPDQIVFSASLNNSSKDARFTSAILQKHTVKFEKSKVSDHEKEVKPHYIFDRVFADLNIFSPVSNPSRVLFECTLNKAPPFYL